MSIFLNFTMAKVGHHTRAIQSGRQLSVTILDKSGFEARHIMALSAHKKESSIRSYRKTDICTKKKMSKTFTTR